MYGQNKYEEAIENYKKAVELNPKYSKGFNNLANALFNNNKYDEAIINYKKALEINNNDYIAYHNLTMLLENLIKEKDLKINILEEKNKKLEFEINNTIISFEKRIKGIILQN